MVAAAVERADGHDVRSTGVDGGQQGGRQRGHTGGEGHGRIGVFEFGQSRFEPRHAGLPEALVDSGVTVVGRVPGSEPFIGVPAGADVIDRIGGGQVDGGDMDACLREAFHSAVDHSGLGMHCGHSGIQTSSLG